MSVSSPRRLTVLQTLPALHSGGVERGTLEIARALVKAGHRSIVVSNGGQLVEQLEREGSEHITMPVHRKSLASLFQIRPFRRLLAELKPDIVHARSRIPAWISWLALRKMDAETRPHFVTTVHGMYSVSPYSAIMTKGEVVIAVSDAVLGYIRKNYPKCPENQIKLIYRGADTTEFPFNFAPKTDWLTQWQKDFPELIGKTVLALPGRLAPVKGHESFLRLIKDISKDHHAIHGLIIGGAEVARKDYEHTLHEKIIHLGLQDKISFTGHRDDMAEVLSQTDLVLSLRTTPEAFGRTTLEPLRIGKPVIGWDEGGVGEILRSLFPFGAVKAHDMESLKDRVRLWLSSPCYPLESDAFQLSTMCTETLSVYERLASKARGN